MKFEISKKAQLTNALINAAARLEECWRCLRSAEEVIDPDGGFEISTDELGSMIDLPEELADQILERAKKEGKCN